MVCHCCRSADRSKNWSGRMGIPGGGTSDLRLHWTLALPPNLAILKPTLVWPAAGTRAAKRQIRIQPRVRIELSNGRSNPKQMSPSLPRSGGEGRGEEASNRPRNPPSPRPPPASQGEGENSEYFGRWLNS